MDIKKLLVVVFFLLSVLIVVQLAPNVQTANNTAYVTYNGSTEKASMIGLGTLMPFGDVLIIISILVAAGLLTMKIRSGASISDIITPVMLVIVVIIALDFYDSIITSFNTLIAGASAGFGKIFYGVILLLIYLLIIALPNSYFVAGKVKGMMGGGKKSSKTTVTTLP